MKTQIHSAGLILHYEILNLIEMLVCVTRYIELSFKSWGGHTRMVILCVVIRVNEYCATVYILIF